MVLSCSVLPLRAKVTLRRWIRKFRRTHSSSVSVSLSACWAESSLRNLRPPRGWLKGTPFSSSSTLRKKVQAFFWRISKINWVSKWVLFNALTHCAKTVFIRSEFIPSFQEAIFHQPCTDAFPDQVFKGIAPTQTLQLPLPPYPAGFPAARTITSWGQPLPGNASRASVMDWNKSHSPVTCPRS